MANTRAKHWCFTLNNPQVDIDRAIIDSLPDLAYAVYQLERGENNTEHFQGVVGFNGRLYFNQVKKLLPRAHIEWAKKPMAAIRYAQKEETRIDGPWLIGDVPQGSTQGKRTDIHEAVDTIRAGTTVFEMMDKHPAITLRHTNNVMRLMAYYIPPRDFFSRVIVLTGLS